MLDVVAPEVLWEDSTQVTSRSLGIVEDLQEQADALVARIVPPKDALVVDIGSNDGTLLKFFKNHGLRVVGVEPAGFVVNMAWASEIPTVQGYFSLDLAKTIKGEWGPAKIISANRVIANIDDLADVAAGIRVLLEPDGVFVFETGYLVNILENDLFETVYHEHLGYDSVKPLDTFFRSQGMELIDVEHLAMKGGSLRGTAQLIGGPRGVSTSVAELIAKEESMGIYSAEPFKAFTKRIEATNLKLNGLLSELEANGNTIAGYGASQTSTTMIYHFGLGEALSFLVDDDPKNQGQFTPGHHIPVLSPEAIYDRNPDYVLMLAWRYAEPIIRKHRTFLDQGGHFIVPMPQLEVI